MIIRRSIIRVLKFAAFVVLGGIAAIVVAAALYLSNLPDLEPWHKVHFDQEYRADTSAVDLDDYLALEDRLFAELDRELLSRLDFGTKDTLKRFQKGSVSNPETWPVDWNRTFVLENDTAAASVLLLHGMSDAPYSLRSLAENLHKAGANVVGLRLPGHGTAPSGLLDITAEDMNAATALAIKSLHRDAPGRPIHVIGYSNGAALAVVYALRQLEDPDLPPLSSIVIVSPAIGVTPAAAYAPAAIQLGHILGVQRLAWNTVGPEYDPYKYISFAVNAGYVTYRLTAEIADRMAALQASDALAGLPPILGFSSVVDATVVAQDMISNLYAKLPENGSELVLYDTNRVLTRLPVLKSDSAGFIDPIVADPDRTYNLKLITNASPTEKATVQVTYPKGSGTGTESPTGISWPDGVYSLAHVSLPFGRNDPLYGVELNPQISRLQLGALALRGERGISEIPASDMLRMRWNPFHGLMMREIRRFLHLPGKEAS